VSLFIAHAIGLHRTSIKILGDLFSLPPIVLVYSFVCRQIKNQNDQSIQIHEYVGY